MSEALREVWLAHLAWDVVANRRKARRDAARLLIFGLLVLAAVLGVLATELASQTLAAVSAASSAVAALMTREAAGPTVEKDWLTARAISEALKSEAFRFAVRVGDYGGPDGDSRLLEAKVAIESDNVSGHPSSAEQGSASDPPWEGLSEADYLRGRVDDQINWYERSATSSSRHASAWRVAALVLGVIGTVISGFAAVYREALWLGAWSGVVGTLAGVVAAHTAAFRYSYHARSYELTARRLRQIRTEYNLLRPEARPARWPEFVQRFEGEISRERGEWLTKWRTQATELAAERLDA